MTVAPLPDPLPPPQPDSLSELGPRPSVNAAPRDIRTLAIATAMAVVVVATLAWLFAPVTSYPFADGHDLWLLGGEDRWQGFGDGRFSWMLSSFRGVAWRPLFWMSFGVDHMLGDTAAILHRSSLVLHIAGALAVAGLAYASIQRACAKGPARSAVNAVLACLAAFAWAAHPLRAEPIATLSARGDLLATLFLALAGIAWLRALGSDSEVRRRPALLACVLGAAAVLSQPASCGYPLALLALTIFAVRDRAAPRDATRWLVIASAPAAVALLVNVIGAPTGLGGAAAPAFGGLGTALAAAHRLAAPIRDTLWPTALHAFHGAPALFPDAIEPSLWVDGATVLVLALFAAASLRRGGGFGLAALAYVGLVAGRVALIATPFGSDTDAHLATMPLFVAVVVATASLGARATAVSVLALIAAAIAAAVTFPSALAPWESPRALWAHVLQVDPANDRALAALGDDAARGGRSREAEAFYRRSIDRHGWRPYGHTGIGGLQLEGGDPRVGIEQLTLAAREAPWLPEPPFLLGSLLLRQGAPNDAVTALTAAVGLDSESAPAWFQLGLARRAVGDFAAAADALARAVALSPADTRYQDELAAAKSAAARAADQPPPPR